MEVEYKGYKGEKIIDDDGKELIVLTGEELEDLVWIEVKDNEIRATNIDPLKKIMDKYNISNVEIIEEKLSPGLSHFIINI